jgi:hypothetical protein
MSIFDTERTRRSRSMMSVSGGKATFGGVTEMSANLARPQLHVSSLVRARREI